MEQIGGALLFHRPGRAGGEPTTFPKWHLHFPFPLSIPSRRRLMSKIFLPVTPTPPLYFPTRWGKMGHSEKERGREEEDATIRMSAGAAPHLHVSRGLKWERRGSLSSDRR